MIDMTYNRSERVYEWIQPETGTVFTFDSQEKKSGKAFQSIVGLLDPDLHKAALHIIETHPQLERGVWKAVEIICKNGVEVYPEMRGNVYAMVESSDGFGRYAITSEDGYTTCQCEHFQSYAAPMTESANRYCKHILAYHLHLVTRVTEY